MLDAYQRRAVEAQEPRIMCIAGAGSGKTRVLTSRVLHLVEKGTALSQLCVVTFSKAAAMEMEGRILPPDTSGFLSRHNTGLQIGTIHSLCYKILRGAMPGRTVADRGHAKRLMRKAMQETGSREKFADVANAITAAKRDMTPVDRRFASVFQAYQHLLQQGRVWDFDDLLVQAVRVLEDQERPATRAKWEGAFEEILVDEVQDTSRVQWRALKALCTPETRLFLVGDMAQSVYSFRGAYPEVLAEVEHDLGPFARYELPVNYRSRPQVVALANRVLANHPGGVVLLPTRDAGPHTPIVAQLPVSGSAFQEGKEIASALQQAKALGLIEEWDDAAILVRVNAATEPIETALAEAAVPAIVMGGVGFYGRTEVQDVLAYLRLVLDWDYEALRRIYNRPSRYLGQVFLTQLEAQGGWQALVEGRARIDRRYERGARQLVEGVQRLRIQSQGDPGVAVRLVLRDLGYETWCLGETPTDGQGEESDAAEALREVFHSLQLAADRWKTIPEFLALADLCARRSKASALGRVRISTVHRFKGLEAPLVIIAAMNDGVMPHKRGNRDEERRIFYVAVTRARDILLLSATQPSLFFRECAQHVGPARELLAQGGLADGADDTTAEGDSDGEGTADRGRPDPDPDPDGTGGSGGPSGYCAGARQPPDW